MAVTRQVLGASGDTLFLNITFAPPHCHEVRAEASGGPVVRPGQLETGSQRKNQVPTLYLKAEVFYIIAVGLWKAWTEYSLAWPDPECSLQFVNPSLNYPQG